MVEDENGSSADRPSSAETLHRMLRGFSDTQLIYVMAKLGVADMLYEEPTPLEQLAEAVGADQAALGRLMHELVHCGLVREDDEGVFHLTPAGTLLRTGADDSLRNLALLYGEINYPAWGNLLHIVRMGQPAPAHAFGARLPEYLTAAAVTGN